MERQERIGTWCTLGVILLSWIGFFLVLALMVRATGCNRSSEAGTQSMDIVAESAGFGPLQPGQQNSLNSQPVSSFGSRRRDRPMVTGPGYPRRDS